MTTGFGASPTDPDELGWWYQDGVVRKGPASLAEMRRLSGIGLLKPETLVWRETFGEHWKRLDETEIWVPDARPVADYGRWTKCFAKYEAQPKRWQWSFFGQFCGPIAYFWYGMWRKGLVILSACLAIALIVILIANANGMPTSRIPYFFVGFFCAINLKRDYYKHRVLGERMWPRLQFADNVYSCSGVTVALVVAVFMASLANDADALGRDVEGVWQSGGAKVVIDVGGSSKWIIIDGVRHYVRFESVDANAGVIVYRESGTLIALQKHYSEDRSQYTLDLLVDDRFVANLTYVRPV